MASRFTLIPNSRPLAGPCPAPVTASTKTRIRRCSWRQATGRQHACPVGEHIHDAPDDPPEAVVVDERDGRAIQSALQSRRHGDALGRLGRDEPAHRRRFDIYRSRAWCRCLACSVVTAAFREHVRKACLPWRWVQGLSDVGSSRRSRLHRRSNPTQANDSQQQQRAAVGVDLGPSVNRSGDRRADSRPWAGTGRSLRDCWVDRSNTISGPVIAGNAISTVRGAPMSRAGLGAPGEHGGDVLGPWAESRGRCFHPERRCAG